jgi:hypothetical protein
MLRGILCVAAWLAVTMTVVAQLQTLEHPAGLSGYVLTPQGVPVSGGTVRLHRPGSQRVAAIESTGRFRMEALAPGAHDVDVSVPGFMTRRLKIAIPSTGRLVLPPLQLSAASYLRVRFVSPSGDAVTSLRIARRSFDVGGTSIPVRTNEVVAIALSRAHR